MIADVLFDVPVRRAFSYAVPPDVTLRPGQRVSAPLHGRSRVGVVALVRQGDEAALKPIDRAVESAPIASAAALRLSRWAADQSLSPWGSTLLSLLPPPPRTGASEPFAPPPEPAGGAAPSPEVWIGASRARRLVDLLRTEAGSALVIAPDREGAARWAKHLEAARLDSGASEAARRAAWLAAARGRARVVVGTRSALLAPLPPPATLVLLEEHDPAHKPPGAPRLHSRDLLRERAAIEASRLLFLSATPSAETWAWAEPASALRPPEGSEPWPEIVASDARGILRNHPLTLTLTRAIEDATRRGRKVALLITRRAAAIICADCGAIVRCARCGVPLPFGRSTAALPCRLCALVSTRPDQCPTCGSHRLAPLGWDAERVEAAVARRFPRVAVSRSDPTAQVLVGPPALLSTLPPGKLGCVGIVSLDGLLGALDFRGGERAFQTAWAAAAAVAPSGRVVVQTLHPTHYALAAVQAHDLSTFYAHELGLRADLGYPPFRRLCTVAVRGPSDGEARARIEECARALDGIGGLTVYPPAPAAPAAVGRWQFVIKGPDELPRLIGPALEPLLESRRRRSAVVEIEMDPA